MSIRDHLKPAGRVNGKIVYYGHHIRFFEEHGYVPNRVGTTSDGMLYDMAYGTPITNAIAVPHCKLWVIFNRYPDISDREAAAIRQPPPDHVLDEALDYFRRHGVFAPIGDRVIDKATATIKLRRIVIEYLAQRGDLCFDEGCFRLA